MATVACVQMGWNGRRFPIQSVIYRDGKCFRRARFMPLDVHPEPEYPAGRKGLVMAAGWETFGKRASADGMLVLDGDVAVDPTHVAAMLACVDSDPAVVWTAPVRIWPASTHRPDWVWAHWEHQASQTIDTVANYFSFNFTYLPAVLLQFAIARGMRKWVYPRVDSNMAAVARRVGVKGRVVQMEPPVHMHWA